MKNTKLYKFLFEQDEPVAPTNTGFDAPAKTEDQEEAEFQAAVADPVSPNEEMLTDEEMAIELQSMFYKPDSQSLAESIYEEEVIAEEGEGLESPDDIAVIHVGGAA